MHFTDTLIEDCLLKETHTLSTAEKASLWVQGKRRENVRACGDPKLYDLCDALARMVRSDIRNWHYIGYNNIQGCFASLIAEATNRNNSTLVAGISAKQKALEALDPVAVINRTFYLQISVIDNWLANTVKRYAETDNADSLMLAINNFRGGWTEDWYIFDRCIAAGIMLVVLNKKAMAKTFLALAAKQCSPSPAYAKPKKLTAEDMQDCVKKAVKQGQTAEYIFTVLKSAGAIEESLVEAVEKHDTLNPKLWNEDNTLKQEVTDKINEIVDTFLKQLEDDEIKIKVKDIKLVGSNCSYNYNDKSDLDIHIVADVDNMNCPDNLYPLLYDAYRNIWGKTHSINFYGIPVELFVETSDVEKDPALEEAKKVGPLHSNGIYSVKNNKWVKEPVAADIPEIDQDAFDLELAKIKPEVELATTSEDLDTVADMIDELYDMRKTGMEGDGEYSIENLVFKEIRNLGYLDQLKELRNKLESAKLSLEEMLINESQAQEISNSYRSLSKIYGVDLEELVYGADGFMNACYPNGFPDFAGDIIYSEQYWTEFEQWLKTTKGIVLKSVNDDGWEEAIDESLLKFIK